MKDTVTTVKNYGKKLRMELVYHHGWKLKQLLIYLASFMFNTADEARKFTVCLWMNHIPITTPEVWTAHCVLIYTRISYLSAELKCHVLAKNAFFTVCGEAGPWDLSKTLSFGNWLCFHLQATKHNVRGWLAEVVLWMRPALSL